MKKIKISIEDAIRTRLEDAFAPTYLEVINNSHLHAKHSSSPKTGQSHFAVVIASNALTGSRVAQHRQVQATLKELMSQGLHALEIKVMD